MTVELGRHKKNKSAVSTPTAESERGACRFDLCSSSEVTPTDETGADKPEDKLETMVVPREAPSIKYPKLGKRIFLDLNPDEAAPERTEVRGAGDVNGGHSTSAEGLW